MLFPSLIIFSFIYQYLAADILSITSLNNFAVGAINKDSLYFKFNDRDIIFNSKTKEITTSPNPYKLSSITNTYFGYPKLFEFSDKFILIDQTQVVTFMGSETTGIYSIKNEPISIPSDSYLISADESFFVLTKSIQISYYSVSPTKSEIASKSSSGTSYAAIGGFFCKNEKLLYVFAQRSSSYSFNYFIYNVIGNQIEQIQEKSISVISSFSDIQPFLISRNIPSIHSFVVCGAKKMYYTTWDDSYNLIYHYYYSTFCSSGEYTKTLIGFSSLEGLQKDFGHEVLNVPSYNLAVLSESEVYVLSIKEGNNLYLAFFQHNFNQKKERTTNINTATISLSDIRFVLLDQYKLYFTYFSRTDSTIQGFLYYYPYCENEIITITKLKITELKDTLKSKGQYIKFTITNNLIKTKTDGIKSIVQNKDYLIEDIFISPTEAAAATSITVNFVLSTIPERDIFGQIFSSECTLTIIVCDNSCLKCDGNTINLCLECDNEAQFYRQNFAPRKCYKGNIPDGQFLDLNSKSIQKCHIACKTCKALGDDSNTQCDKCNDGYYTKIGEKHCTQNAPTGYVLDNGFWKPCYSKCNGCTKLESLNAHYCINCASGYSLYYIKERQSNQCYQTKTNPESKFYIDKSNLEYHDLGLIKYCPSGYQYLEEKTGECSSDCSFYDPKKNTTYDLFMYYNKCISTCPVGTTLNTTIKKCINIKTFKCSDINLVVSDVEPLPIILNNNQTIIRYIQPNDNVQYRLTINQNNKKGYFYNYEDYTLINYDTLFYANIIGYRPIETGTTDEIKYQLFKGNEIQSNECKMKITICEKGCKADCNSGNFCVSCIDGYYFLKIGNKTQCVKECIDDYFYYSDTPRKECFFDCNDSINKYSYMNKCVSSCPTGTQPHLNKCIDNSFFDNEDDSFVKVSYNKKKAEEILVSNLNAYIDIGNKINGTDFILEVYSTDKLPDKDSKVSNIDLSQCISILKTKNQIDESTPLIITKFDTNEKFTSVINKVEYKIYNSENNKELDLFYCENTNISISYPLHDTEELNISNGLFYSKQLIDIYNPEDKFFNDMCYDYSEDGKDILINDRRQYIYNNITICGEGCEYLGINYTSKKVNCNCNCLFSKNKITTNKNFTKQSVPKHNIYSFKCSKQTFTFKNLVKNPGFWVSFTEIICQIGFLGYFLKKGISTILVSSNPPTHNKKEDITEKEERSNFLSVNIFLKNGIPLGNLPLVDPKEFKTQQKIEYNPKYKLNTDVADGSDSSINIKGSFSLKKEKTTFEQNFLPNIENGVNIFCKSLIHHHFALKPFCGLTKYELFSLHFSLLILTLLISLVLNGLFITNTYVSNRFLGKASLSDLILKAFYASLIEIVIRKLLQNVTNYYSYVFVTIQEEKKVTLELIQTMSKQYKKRITIYYIINLIVSLVLGYYLSVMLHTYSKNIIPLIISFCFCFLFSFGYSIIFCLLLVFTTIYGSKYHSSLLYNMSLGLQSELLK